MANPSTSMFVESKEELEAWMLMMGFTKARRTGSVSLYQIMGNNGVFCRVTIADMIKVEWTAAHYNNSRISFSCVMAHVAFQEICAGLEEQRKVDTYEYVR